MLRWTKSYLARVRIFNQTTIWATHRKLCFSDLQNNSLWEDGESYSSLDDSAVREGGLVMNSARVAADVRRLVVGTMEWRAVIVFSTCTDGKDKMRHLYLSYGWEHTDSWCRVKNLASILVICFGMLQWLFAILLWWYKPVGLCCKNVYCIWLRGPHYLFG